MKLWYAFCTALLFGIVLLAADPSPLGATAVAMTPGAIPAR